MESREFSLKYNGLSPDEKPFEVEFFWLPTRSSSDFILARQAPSCFKAEADCTYKTDSSKVAFLSKMNVVDKEICETA